MAKIPDLTDLGGRPIPRPSRSVKGYNPGISARAGREAANQKVADATRDFNTGMSIINTTVNVMEMQDAAAARKARREHAAATSAFLLSKVQWDGAFREDNDYEIY